MHFAYRLNPINRDRFYSSLDKSQLMLDTSKKSGNPALELDHRNNKRDILDDVIDFAI